MLDFNQLLNLSEPLKIDGYLSGKEIQQDEVLQDYLILCGSRHMNSLYPDVIQITEDTDWDFYAPNYTFIHERLEELGLACTPGTRYPFDDLAVAVYSGYNFQIILRSDTQIYSQVLRNLDPEFYRDYLWKSGPNSPSREQIQRIFNQMFKIAED